MMNILTLESVKIKPNGPARVHLVSFLRSQELHLVNQPFIWLTNLAGDHLEPSQGPLVVPGPLVENPCCMLSNWPPLLRSLNLVSRPTFTPWLLTPPESVCWFLFGLLSVFCLSLLVCLVVLLFIYACLRFRVICLCFVSLFVTCFLFCFSF